MVNNHCTVLDNQLHDMGMVYIMDNLRYRYGS